MTPKAIVAAMRRTAAALGRHYAGSTTLRGESGAIVLRVNYRLLDGEADGPLYVDVTIAGGL
jgi:hypothetical protein